MTTAVPFFIARLLEQPGPWVCRAACRGADPDLFFPEKGLPTSEAKAICRRCPVQPQCLDWAILNRERHGVWGGLSSLERRRSRPAPDHTHDDDGDGWGGAWGSSMAHPMHRPTSEVRHGQGGYPR